MKRRDFLKAIAAVPVVGLASKGTAEQPPTITLPTSKAKPLSVRWEGSDSFDFVDPHPIECIEQIGDKLAILDGIPQYRYIRFVVSGPEPSGQIALTDKRCRLHIMTNDDILDSGNSIGANVLYVRNIK